MKAALLQGALCFVLALTSPAPGPRGVSPAAPSQSVVVRMTTNLTFEPQVVTVRIGDEVVWQNEDHAVHSVVGDPLLALHRIDIEPPAPPEPFHSGDIAPGERFRRVFSLPGVYRYVCRYHEEHGMN